LEISGIESYFLFVMIYKKFICYYFWMTLGDIIKYMSRLFFSSKYTIFEKKVFLAIKYWYWFQKENYWCYKPFLNQSWFKVKGIFNFQGKLFSDFDEKSWFSTKVVSFIENTLLDGLPEEEIEKKLRNRFYINTLVCDIYNNLKDEINIDDFLKYVKKHISCSDNVISQLNVRKMLLIHIKYFVIYYFLSKIDDDNLDISNYVNFISVGWYIFWKLKEAYYWNNKFKFSGYKDWFKRKYITLKETFNLFGIYNFLKLVDKELTNYEMQIKQVSDENAKNAIYSDYKLLIEDDLLLFLKPSFIYVGKYYGVGK